MSLEADIIGLLDNAQSSLHHHQKLLKAFRALHDKHDPITFFEAFFAPFTNALLVYKREPAVERVVDFVTKFATSVASKAPEEEEEEEDGSGHDDAEMEVNFFTLFLAKLLGLHEARDKAVRFRVCQLIAKLMSNAADFHCVVGADLMDSVVERMLQRAHDKVPAVRVQAVSALEFLQETDAQCPVTSTLIDLLRKDSSPEVRQCVLSKIAVTDRTLPAVIERTRDVKDMIRRDAFCLLAEKCTIRHLTINQRIQLLTDGLHDHSEIVQEACVSGLLRSWSLTLDGDFLTLLSRLDVESSPEVAELALVKLFENFSSELLVSGMVTNMGAGAKVELWGEETPVPTPRKGGDKEEPLTAASAAPDADPMWTKVIPLDVLKSEEAFCWSSLCRYFHKEGPKGEDSLEQIVPTLSEFCDYVEKYVVEVLLEQKGIEDRMQSQFVAQQLFSIFSVLDLSDEVGRRRLGGLLCDLLVMPGFPAGLTSPLLVEQKRIWPQESYRVEKLTEVIADLRQPPMVDTTQAPANEEDSQLATNLSYLELRDDPDTLLRCLAIACEILKALDIKKLSPTLQTLVHTLLLPCVQNENPYVRDMALHCLGLACLLDISTARNHLLLFLQVSQVDHESVQATALKVVFDLLHVFGFEAFHMGDPNKYPDNNAPEAKDEDMPGEGDGEGGEGEGVGGPEESAAKQELENTGDSEVPSTGEEGEQEEEGERSDHTTQRILSIMADFLEGESSLLREVAAEGIAKLLMSGRILSQKLVAKLLILWYNPLTQEEAHLRNVLGVFFPAFASSDKNCRECLREVYMPVMQMVVEAPSTSPLSDIEAGNIAEFLVQLTRPSKPNEDSVHDSLAITVANAVLSDPTDSAVRIFCKSLNQMELTASNKGNSTELLVLWEQMKQEVTDRISLRYLEKFGAMLKKINPPAVIQSSSSESVLGGGGDTTIGIPSAESDETLVGISPTQDGQTTTGRKATVRKTAAVRGTARRTSQRRVTFAKQLSSEEDEENVDPASVAALPTRTPSSRISKTRATQHLAESALAVSSSGEESDDSLVGDHSPFVKRSINRQRPSSQPLTLRVLQYSDDEDLFNSHIKYQ